MDAAHRVRDCYPSIASRNMGVEWSERLHTFLKSVLPVMVQLHSPATCL